MSKNFGWINNQWGSLDQLAIPINDRGLNYGDGIFETILIWQGMPKLLKEHLARWKRSAQVLEMEEPPEEEMILTLINEGINLCSLQQRDGAVRLNWSRGSNLKRGIDIHIPQFENSTNRFWLELNPIEANFSPVSVMISNTEKRNGSSQLNGHKTFAYGQAIQTRQEAKRYGFDDALIESTLGGICCGSAANLIVKRNDEYLTPSLQSGCLPGIMRQQGINSGIIKEKIIDVRPMVGDQWLLINSLSCRPIYKVNNVLLEAISSPQDFWSSLYNL